MIVNLIKAKQMFSLTLPQKIKGQYWLTDTDNLGNPRRIVSIEAESDNWVVKSNSTVKIYGSESKEISSCVLNEKSFLIMQNIQTSEKMILFSESLDETYQTLSKIIVKEPAVFSIGRTEDNHFCFDNNYVSTHHAKLMFDGRSWSISDQGSRNGTFVNGYRVQTQKLNAGDFIYIMGLKIVIGSNFLAVNNPEKKLKIKSDSLLMYKPPKTDYSREFKELPTKDYFFRPPRFYREAECEEITIDPPPQMQKPETVPLALMLGPSLTMAMTSVSTAIISLTNVLSSGGNITQALPTMIMSLGMLMGTVLWPILTKRYEKKQKILNEQERQEKYLAYLGEINSKIRRLIKEQSNILNENLVSQDECTERIIRRKQSLWERVIGQKDFLRLRLGIGTLPLDVSVKYQEKKFSMEDDALQNSMLALAETPKELQGVPISISLKDNIVTGIIGERSETLDMLKSLLLQMIALHSYDELKIILILNESDEEFWQFAKYIPHFWSNDRTARFFASNMDEVKALSAYTEKVFRERPDRETRDEIISPHYVCICTDAALGKKCEALQNLIKYKNNVGFSAIFLGDSFADLPKETKTTIQVNGTYSKIFDKEDTSGEQVIFDAEKSGKVSFDNIASAIANIELDLSSESFSLPTMMTFLEMFRVGKVEHLNSLTRWKENNPTKSLQTPVGVGADGDDFLLDLHEKYHGPHGLVAGMTGSGKSEFIITYILSLAVNYHPDEVAFILIDYKGGGLTGAFEDADRNIKLPHLAGTITNLDGAAIKRSLVSIQSELRRRQSIFNEARKISNEGTMDIYKYQQLYRDKVVKEPVPHLFIISDEFAELKTQQPEFMEQLISAARIGRSLGVHLILATQKPSGVVDDQIWSNSKFRVCLKVQEKSDSQDMIKCPDAAELSQTGRFYLQVGFNELFAMGQSAWCGAEYIPSDTYEKAVDSSIQVVDNLGRPVMNVKAEKNALSSKSNAKQLVSIVKYLSDLASEENVEAKPLWLAPIPFDIYLEETEHKYKTVEKGFALNPVIGEYDDPFNQRQGVLTVPLTKEGNCIVYGATGNGKTTFLTTLCYSLIKNHTPQELNLYIMDFGSETLKMFENAPHTGGVITSADEEKTVNFFKMLRKEIETRKAYLSDFGGDFVSCCEKGNKSLPNIVVVINNYSGFAEQFEDLQDEFSQLSRDGMKYGIYFVISASSINAVRYRTQQNCKMIYTMQLNDPSDYAVVVGKTDGLVPSKCKGRGLVPLDRVFEFQTAYCCKGADTQDYIKSFCSQLSEKATAYAKPIPVLPKVVNLDFVRKQLGNLSKLPVGVAKNNLNVVTYSLKGIVALPVVSQNITEQVEFIEEFVNVISASSKTVILDTEKLIEETKVECITKDFENTVNDIFKEMVSRNNKYKDALMDESVLNDSEETVYVIVGFKRLMDSLSADGKDKLRTLISKAEAIYKIHFVICEEVKKLNEFSYDEWFKRQLSGEGIWIGDGVADQYLLKVSKVTSALNTEIGSEYGYMITRGRPVLMKVLSSGTKEDM